MDTKRQGCKSSALPRRLDPPSPSIMQSLDSLSIMEQSRQFDERSWLGGLQDERPDVTMTENILNLQAPSFLLIDGEERLKVPSMEQFVAKLRLPVYDTKLKVVSIFGYTGDGKSYTMNHTFFNGNNVFQTSGSASSCTVGAMAAYDPNLKIICIDTEGFLGSTSKENERTRLLLKILAISDVVIYRTRSERLQRDLFTFLGSASKAFSQHFQVALQRVALGSPLSALGPAVIIFHETKHTEPLQNSVPGSPEEFLREKFSELKLNIDAFSSIRYVGIKSSSVATDFSKLRRVVQLELENTTIRSPRSPGIIYNTLKILNERFSEELDSSSQSLFPDQYFTCPEVCLSCKTRCQSTVGHHKDNLPHNSDERCVFQSQHDNYQFRCKKCHANGIEQIIEPKTLSNSVSPWYGLAKYVWSGYTLECPTCGELYTSRQQWYGNRGPEDCPAILSDLVHVWSDTNNAGTTQNTAQRVLDGVSYLSEAVVGVVAQPSKAIGSYVADQIAPKYWRPNSEITHCVGCGTPFAAAATKHHCRNCGEGFCENCSSQTCPVPRHGWLDPVRVCDSCYSELNQNGRTPSLTNPADVRARRYGEMVLQTISSVSSVLYIPKDIIKDSARPSYWVPDSDISKCCVCAADFDQLLTLHHCRDCGKGVCDPCSPHRRAVPTRGWEKPVRVCNNCFQTS